MLRHILLGIGITLIGVSLSLMVIDLPAASQPEQITEEEVINRAQKLGMNFPAAYYRQGIALESGVKLTETIAQLATEQQKQEEVKPTVEPQSKTDTQSTSKTQQKVTIKITRGMQGWEVAELLVNKGLLVEQDEFIKLLEKFNIERKIMAGTYQFEPGVSKLEVLLTITTN